MVFLEAEHLENRKINNLDTFWSRTITKTLLKITLIQKLKQRITQC